MPVAGDSKPTSSSNQREIELETILDSVPSTTTGEQQPAGKKRHQANSINSNLGGTTTSSDHTSAPAGTNKPTSRCVTPTYSELEAPLANGSIIDFHKTQSGWSVVVLDPKEGEAAADAGPSRYALQLRIALVVVNVISVVIGAAMIVSVMAPSCRENVYGNSEQLICSIGPWASICISAMMILGMILGVAAIIAASCNFTRMWVPLFPLKSTIVAGLGLVNLLLIAIRAAFFPFILVALTLLLLQVVVILIMRQLVRVL